MDCSRRDLLKWGAAAMATWGAGTTVYGAEGRRRRRMAGAKIPIGLQLYSVRNDCEKDLPGTLKAVAGMGYQGVEFAGYYGRKPEELRKLLDDNKLRCCGTHIGLDTLLGDQLKKAVEFNRTIGNRYLIVSYMGEDRLGTIEKAKETAKLFTELAAKVKGERMRVGYHAHGGDFKKIDGKTRWEAFFDNAGPEVVMQMDLGNCMEGGGDPIAMLKKYPGRSATIHLKEHGGKPGAVIGEGVVKWQQDVFPICESTGGTNWYIVEQESYAGSPLDSVKRCLENLRRMGK
jgi:sugar phosphate isomerase/epimerase